MGLDIVELVMRCEEVFEIQLRNDEMELVRTVGDLYFANCKELKLEPCVKPDAEKGFHRLQGGTLNLRKLDWNAEDAWATLVAIFVDQLQLDEDQIIPSARIAEDLRAD